MNHCPEPALGTLDSPGHVGSSSCHSTTYFNMMGENVPEHVPESLFILLLPNPAPHCGPLLSWRQVAPAASLCAQPDTHLKQLFGRQANCPVPHMVLRSSGQSTEAAFTQPAARHCDPLLCPGGNALWVQNGLPELEGASACSAVLPALCSLHTCIRCPPTYLGAPLSFPASEVKSEGPGRIPGHAEEGLSRLWDQVSVHLCKGERKANRR